MYSLNRIIKTISLIALTLGYFGLAPQPRAISSVDTFNHHIWRPLGALDNGVTYPTAKLGDGFNLRPLGFADRVAYQRAIEEV